MQVTAGGRNGCVSEGGLDKVDGGAAVEGVRGVRVTKPVRRDRVINSRLLRCLADNAEDRRGLKGLRAFSGAKHRLVVRSGATLSV